MPTLLIIIAAVLAAFRIAGHASAAFQAVAHLFVGGLFTAAYMHNERQSSAFYFWIAVILSVIELVCFVVSHLEV